MDKKDEIKRLLSLAIKDKDLGPMVLKKNLNDLVLIEHDGKNVGFAIPRLERDGHWRTGPIFIEPGYRKKGIASTWIAEFFKGKKGRAWIEPHNSASQGAFSKAGFHKTGKELNTSGEHFLEYSTESLHRAATPEEKRLIDLALKDPRLGPSAVTTDPDQLFWVYDDHKKKVGFFTPKKEPDGRYRTGTIFIEPSERGKGYGSNAVNSFFNEADMPGRAWIEPTNIPSQTIFKKAGFYKSGRHTMSKTTPRLFEEWINRPEPPLVSRPVLGW